MSGKTMVFLSGIISGVSPTPSSAPSEVPYEISHSNNFLEMIGLVFIMVLILIAAYYTSKYVGKFSMGQFKNSNFKVIDTYRISPNKFLQIVKVANKYIVIAVSKDTVHYITELDENEIFIRETGIKENISFKQILDKMRNKTD